MSTIAFEGLDLALRFAGIGQLLLIVVVLLRLPIRNWKSLLLLAVLPCLAAYLLLTAPADAVFRTWRGSLLALSHTLTPLLWGFGLELHDHRLRPSVWPRSAIVLAGLALFVQAVYFVWSGGRGWAHDLTHGFSLIAMLHLAYLSVTGLADDLVAQRRNARLVFLSLISVQLLIVIGVELTGPWLGEPHVFSVLNAFSVLVAITILGVSLTGASYRWLDSERVATEVGDTRDWSRRERRLHDALTGFIDAGGYRTANLTVTRLAAKLGTTEHTLRRLINGRLGYRNFSSFLNRYRIAEARRRLRAPENADLPVLTIALDLGYGSIAPFNRAFKTMTGRTPSEYRNSA